MTRYIIVILVLLCGFLFTIANSKSNGCHPVKRELGEPFQFICPEYHNGKSHFYHYNLSTGQHQLVYNDSHRLEVIINNLDDAGEYCCSKHPGETLLVNRSHCCIQVEVPTTIQMKTLTISSTATTVNKTTSDNLSLPTTISPMSKPNKTTDQLTTSTLSIPTQNTTNITEQEVKDNITTDTDSSRTETTIDSLKTMIILSVAISFILLLITGLSLILLLAVAWISARKIKGTVLQL